MQCGHTIHITWMVIGHRGNEISCRGKEMFVGSNLVLQWVPGSGKVVRGDTKMSPGVFERDVRF